MGFGDGMDEKASGKAEEAEGGEEIAGNGGGDGEGINGDVVEETERGGVEHGAGDFAGAGGEGGEVVAVAQDWASDGVEVDADLVGASGFDGDGDVGGGVGAADGGKEAHAGEGGEAVDGGVDFEEGFGEGSGDDGVVELFDGGGFELGDEGGAGFGGFGEQDGAGGVFVEAVDGAEGGEG